MNGKVFRMPGWLLLLIITVVVLLIIGVAFFSDIGSGSDSDSDADSHADHQTVSKQPMTGKHILQRKDRTVT